MRRPAGIWGWIAVLGLTLVVIWTASAAAAESTLDQVLKRGKLIVGIGVGTAPYGMYDANKQPVGFDVDLAKLEKDMEAAGAPWTPGRVPEWTEK